MANVIRILLGLVSIVVAVQGADELLDRAALLTDVSLAKPILPINDVYQAIPIEKCCRKQIRYKLISRVVIRYGNEYECRGYIRQGYCAGDCEAKSKYIPPVYIRTYDSAGNKVEEIVDEGEFTPEGMYRCMPKDGFNSEKTVKLTCKARRECCENIDPLEITVYVKYQEPVDCACEKPLIATLDLPCRLVRDERHHYFYLTPFQRCRSVEPINLPYCRGCCRSHEWSYDLDFIRGVENKRCTCCEAVKFVFRKLDLYCWWLNTSTIASSFKQDPDQSEELDLTYRALPVTAKLSYPAACGCRYCKN